MTPVDKKTSQDHIGESNEMVGKQRSQPLYNSDAVPPCEHCGKKLRDANARWQHLKHKHKIGVREGNLKPLPESEPSMAELHVAFLMGDDSAYEPWMEGCDNERIGEVKNRSRLRFELGQIT